MKNYYIKLKGTPILYSIKAKSLKCAKQYFANYKNIKVSSYITSQSKPHLCQLVTSI